MQAGMPALPGGHEGPPLHGLGVMSDTAGQKSVNSPAATQSSFGSTDLLLLLMTLIWGSNFTAIKYSLEDLLPLSFNAMRFTIASIVMLIVAVISRNGFALAPGDGWRLF